MTTESPKRKLSVWLTNPAVYIAGTEALSVGVAIYLFAAWGASLSRTHFDGVLDTHSGMAAPLWFFLAEGLLAWLSVVSVFAVVGKIAARTSFRFIDLAGTQALARSPTLLIAVFALLPGYQRFSQGLTKMVGNNIPPAPEVFLTSDGACFMVVIAVMVAATCWMVALMYRSYAHVCHIRGGRGVGSFVIALILAETLSKVALAYLVTNVLMDDSWKTRPGELSPSAEARGHDKCVSDFTAHDINSPEEMKRKTAEAKTGGLILRYTFDDATSNAVTVTDSSGQEADGILHGHPEFAAGVQGKAMLLDGENDYVELPLTWRLRNVQSSNYTVMAWFYPDTAPPSDKYSYGIVIKPGCDYGIAFDSTLTFRFTHFFTITGEDGEKPSVADHIAGTWLGQGSSQPGQWHHIAVVGQLNEKRFTIFTDGKPVATEVQKRFAASLKNDRPWFIGVADPDVWRCPARGKMDDVRIYSRALSAEEVQSVFSGTNGAALTNADVNSGFTSNTTQTLHSLTIQALHRALALRTTVPFSGRSIWENHVTFKVSGTPVPDLALQVVRALFEAKGLSVTGDELNHLSNFMATIAQDAGKYQHRDIDLADILQEIRTVQDQEGR